ncbi:hypothetical protein ACQP3C_30180, partial [Escherichia coli]
YKVREAILLYFAKFASNLFTSQIYIYTSSSQILLLKVIYSLIFYVFCDEEGKTSIEVILNEEKMNNTPPDEDNSRHYTYIE